MYAFVRFTVHSYIMLCVALNGEIPKSQKITFKQYTFKMSKNSYMNCPINIISYAQIVRLVLCFVPHVLPVSQCLAIVFG